jgi:hypothetical protein
MSGDSDLVRPYLSNNRTHCTFNLLSDISCLVHQLIFPVTVCVERNGVGKATPEEDDANIMRTRLLLFQSASFLAFVPVPESL